MFKWELRFYVHFKLNQVHNKSCHALAISLTYFCLLALMLMMMMVMVSSTFLFDNHQDILIKVTLQ